MDISSPCLIHYFFKSYLNFLFLQRKRNNMQYFLEFHFQFLIIMIILGESFNLITFLQNEQNIPNYIQYFLHLFSIFYYQTLNNQLSRI